MRFSSRDKGVVPPRLVHYLLDHLQTPPSGDPPEGSEAEEDLVEDLQFHNIRKGDSDLQLVIKMDLVLPEGSTLPGVEILIDTGAEVNLIREGLVPNQLLSPAEKTFRFLTADGTQMKGGDKVVQLKMSFQKTTMTNANPTSFETEGLFYQADIQVDAILSHPWLVEKKLGVIPHLKALTALEPELALLRGGIVHPPTSLDQEAESTFWVDHVLAEQIADHQEWFTLNMSLPPDHLAPSAEEGGDTPPGRGGEPTSQLAQDPPYPPYTLPWRERPP